MRVLILFRCIFVLSCFRFSIQCVPSIFLYFLTFQRGFLGGFPGIFHFGLDDNEREREHFRYFHFVSSFSTGVLSGFPGFFHFGLDDNERERASVSSFSPEVAKWFSRLFPLWTR